MSGTQPHSLICMCDTCHARRRAGYIPWDSVIGARLVPDISTQAAISANRAIWAMMKAGGYAGGR